MTNCEGHSDPVRPRWLERRWAGALWWAALSCPPPFPLAPASACSAPLNRPAPPPPSTLSSKMLLWPHTPAPRTPTSHPGLPAWRLCWGLLVLGHQCARSAIRAGNILRHVADVLVAHTWGASGGWAGGQGGCGGPTAILTHLLTGSPGWCPGPCGSRGRVLGIPWPSAVPWPLPPPPAQHVATSSSSEEAPSLWRHCHFVTVPPCHRKPGRVLGPHRVYSNRSPKISHGTVHYPGRAGPACARRPQGLGQRWVCLGRAQLVLPQWPGGHQNLPPLMIRPLPEQKGPRNAQERVDILC